MYGRDIIDEIVRESDIVSVISEYVELKKVGKNYRALCPFHKEKTPSFMVSPEKQLFHCFGCGKGGNVITFVMEIENISFHEAVKKLADRLGISIDEENIEEANEREKTKKRIYRLNERCMRIFYELLLRNEKALSYLENRGVDMSLVKKFMLGWASKKELVKEVLLKSGFSVEDMVQSGVFGKNGVGSLYLRFNNRLIFPVLTTSGMVVGFGGRIIEDMQGVAKYINTPETVVFSKRKELYGLNVAIPSIRKHRKVVIVEGYMDVIALHKNGVDYAIASLGTSLTKEQIRKLVGSVDTVFVAYDSDVAGEMATIRALQLLLGKGISVRVIRIPDGKDPDEFFKKHTVDGWYSLEEKAIPIFDYVLDVFSRQKKEDGSNLKEIVESIVDFLDGFDEIQRDVLLSRTAEKLGLNEATLRKVAFRKKGSEKNIGPEEIDVLVSNKQDRYSNAERELLWLMLGSTQVRGMVKEIDYKTLFRDEDALSLASYIVNEGIWMSEDEIVEALKSTALSSLLSQFVWKKPLQEDVEVVKWAERLIEILNKRGKEDRLKEIEEDIKSGNATPILLKEYVELRKSIGR